MIPRSRQRERERNTERVRRRSLYNCIARSLLDRSPRRRKTRRGALPAVPLSIAERDICACFSENKSRGPSDVPACAYAIRAFLLRPCRADRRMRFSRAPAYPSRNYLGRESSSLPRPFPSLLAIRGGARLSLSDVLRGYVPAYVSRALTALAAAIRNVIFAKLLGNGSARETAFVT